MKGIYKITQESTGKVYIGQSINIDNRWNQHACSVDSLSFHEAYSKDPTDFSFRIIVQNDAYTEADLNALEKYYIKSYDANNPKRGFNATKGNGESVNNVKGRMKPVTGSINRAIHTKYLGGLTNKNILVIGQFRIDTLALYNNIVVISDDYNYTCEDVKIIRVSGAAEIMKELDKIKAGQFDLIIANPPYNKGNAIINACVTKAKESIVLMPFSCYKAGNLYKHILSLDLADPKAFKDATITNNLCVCNLIDKEIDQTFEELELETFDSRYREFYELNQKLSPTVENINHLGGNLPYNYAVREDLPINLSFGVTTRTVLDGAHKSNKAFDYRWNVEKIKDYSLLHVAPQGGVTMSFIYLPTQTAYDHFVTFWYKNPLTCQLIRGLRKVSGTPAPAIPNIDWSVDRDYEHLTYEELLSIMRAELKK